MTGTKNEIRRCPWCENDELLTPYHDTEWGVPVHDDRKHFEFLILEINQAGLSWKTVLNKRGAFRKAFDDFNPAKVAMFGPKETGRLITDSSIIRNRQKIEAAVVNANQFIRIQEEFGSFDRYIWDFVDFQPVVNGWQLQALIPARTTLSDKIADDLKKRGFKFVGSTIVYAHLQATGLVNDHLVSCFRYRELTGGPA